MTNQQENKINEEIDKIINKINKNIIIKSQVMQLYKNEPCKPCRSCKPCETCKMCQKGDLSRTR